MFRRGDGDERHDAGPIMPAEVHMSSNANGSEVTVVGKGAKLDGTLVSAGSLRIDGQVKGKISADGDVVLSEHSHVEADIHATNVTVAGSFQGNIVAGHRAELAATGKVRGNIRSKSLIVAEGAAFSGQSMMDGDAPAPNVTVELDDSKAKTPAEPEAKEPAPAS